jgi:hypothetical protein
MVLGLSLGVVKMVTRVSVGGLILIVLGLLIVIVHALNMSKLLGVETMLPELGVILIGIAVQLLGLGVILVSKK